MVTVLSDEFKDTHTVSHMFTVTSDRLGTVAGETEYPEVTLLDEGIQVTFTGLSPALVAYRDKEGHKMGIKTND